MLMYFNLVFGELVPKRIALQKAEAFCFLTVQPIYAISKVLSPFIKLLSMSTNPFLHLIGMKTEDLEEAVSEEEIKALLEMGNSRGIFEEHEYEMINSVFSFDDKNARDVMTPRRDVFAIDIADPFEENIEAILESRHSRIPVYKDNKRQHYRDFIYERFYDCHAEKTSETRYSSIFWKNRFLCRTVKRQMSCFVNYREHSTIWQF